MTTLMFFDTGVLLAAYDNADALRRQAARRAIEAAIDSSGLVTSVFVLYEFHRMAVSGLLLSRDEAASAVRNLAKHRVAACDADAVLHAVELQRRHALKLGDAMVVQAALACGCRVLYSDSLPHGLSIDSPRWPRLSVVDPMLPAHPPTAHEPSAAYLVARVVASSPSIAPAIRSQRFCP